MTEHVAYFCGEFMPFSQVRIDPLDRGFLVGDSVFDVARTFNGKSFRMKEHVDRLYRSLRYVRIDPGMSAEEMEALMNASDAEFQDMFLEMMQEHHEGAIEMARTEQAEGEFPDAIDMAESIVTSQQAEIDQIEQLLGS